MATKKITEDWQPSESTVLIAVIHPRLHVHLGGINEVAKMDEARRGMYNCT